MDLGRPPGTETFYVAGFNDKNTIVGGLYGDPEGSFPHLFSWNKETGFVSISDGTSELWVSAIDNDGSIAGTAGRAGWRVWLVLQAQSDGICRSRHPDW